MVLSTYSRTRPVDGFSPTSAYMQVTNAQNLNFGVSPATTPHTFAFGSMVDERRCRLTWQQTPTFSVPSQLLAAGNQPHHCGCARPHHTCSNGSNQSPDTNNFLDRKRLSLAINQQHLARGEQICLSVCGQRSQGFVVQSSTNLVNWTPLSTNFLSAGQFWFTNAPAAGESRRFFRGQIL